MPDALIHPTPQQLAAFGLGKLPERATAAVAAHLESCPACRKAVANVPPDSFLGKVRAAGPHGSSFPPSLAKAGQAPGIAGTPAPLVSCPDLPPELARHPRYLILRELGRGGMGVVYQARHKEMDRQVVIKVINRALLDRPDSLERFHREVRAAALLSHPNIVTAYDAEQVGDSHMLVMEFVPGQTLAEIVQKKGSLPLAHACLFARQVALGLQHAHDRNMVHRDIKPQNLMLSLKNQVKILDFGLAKIFREGVADTSTRLTSHNVYLGTPDYCAPEQALDARSADIRADLYSLGCTLYFLLAGRPPFREDTVVNTILAHQNKQPQPLPDAPAALWQVVARLLAKEPAQRYEKPIELAQALAPFIKSGTKQDAKGTLAPAAGVSSARQGTLIAADTGEIRKILREVPGKTPPKGVSVKEEAASPFADVTDTGSASKNIVHVSEAAKPYRAAWWKRPGVLAIALSISLALILLAFVVIKVKTPEGTIVLYDLPDNAEVTLDGRNVTVKFDDGKAAEIRVAAGKKHRLEVKIGGNVVKGEEVEIAAGERRRLRAKFEQPEARRDNRPPPAPKPAPEDNGFVSLFNGKNLDGWNTRPEWEGSWQVENGILILDNQNRSELRTDREDYGDFHLRAEIRIGHIQYAQLYFRGGYVIALNCINGNPRKTGSLFVPSRGWMTVPKSPVPPDQWFTLEVIAQGNHVAVKVNGQTTAEDSAGRFTHGPITLAGRRHEDSSLEYRKIEIKERK